MGITGAANGASTRHCVCVCLGSSVLPMAKIAVLIIVRSTPCAISLQEIISWHAYTNNYAYPIHAPPDASWSSSNTKLIYLVHNTCAYCRNLDTRVCVYIIVYVCVSVYVYACHAAS